MPVFVSQVDDEIVALAEIEHMPELVVLTLMGFFNQLFHTSAPSTFMVKTHNLPEPPRGGLQRWYGIKTHGIK